RILRAEREMVAAQGRLNRAKTDTAVQLAANELHEATERYLQFGIAELRAAAASPTRPVDQNVRRALANFAGSLASNFAGFSIPTLLAAPWGEHAHQIFPGAVGLMAPAGAELGSRLQRALGGSSIDVTWGLEGSATVGPYKKVLSDFAMTMLNVAVYG